MSVMSVLWEYVFFGRFALCFQELKLQKTLNFIAAFSEMSVLKPKQKRPFVLVLFCRTITHVDLHIHILLLLYLIINFS